VSTIDSGHYGDGVARRTKRLWTDDEKRSICFQTTAPGVSVAQVARRYAVNANLIFKWLRDPRYASDPAAVPSPPVEPRFLPVEIVAEGEGSRDRNRCTQPHRDRACRRSPDADQRLL
jgi:transposase